MEVNNWFHFTNIAEMCPEFRAFAMLLYASKRLRYLCDSHAHIVLSITTFHRWPSPWFGTSMALKAFCTCSAYFTQSGTKRETWGNKLLRNTKLMNKKQRSRRWWWRRFKTNTCMYKYALLKTVRNDFNISTCEDLGISGIHFQFS